LLTISTITIQRLVFTFPAVAVNVTQVTDYSEYTHRPTLNLTLTVRPTPNLHWWGQCTDQPYT